MIETYILPGSSHRLCVRRARSQTERLREKAEKLHGLAAVLARFVPRSVFATDEDERDRIFNPWVTFVAFLGQVLTRGSTCREAVRRVQAWRAASKRSIPDDSTSAYCQARCRRKCGIDEIEDVFDAHGRIEELRFRERRRGRESPTGRRPRL